MNKRSSLSLILVALLFAAGTAYYAVGEGWATSGSTPIISPPIPASTTGTCAAIDPYLGGTLQNPYREGITGAQARGTLNSGSMGSKYAYMIEDNRNYPVGTLCLYYVQPTLKSGVTAAPGANSSEMCPEIDGLGNPLISSYSADMSSSALPNVLQMLTYNVQLAYQGYVTLINGGRICVYATGFTYHNTTGAPVTVSGPST